jgi:hypothetical protein
MALRVFECIMNRYIQCRVLDWWPLRITVHQGPCCLAKDRQRIGLERRAKMKRVVLKGVIFVSGMAAIFHLGD